MLQNVLKKVLRPLRQAAGKFVILPPQASYVGENGCLAAGASFVTWNQVEGDYLEFGVYRGQSFCAAYHQMMQNRRAHYEAGHNGPANQAWRERRPRFFAFDSFEGLPPNQDRTVDYHEGAYRCSLAEFQASVTRGGVDWSDVVVVEGYYDRTLTPALKERHKLRKAALVLIDCDLYESTVPVLDFLTDIVGQGTVIVFHDWFRFQGDPNEGEQRACREWQAKNPQFELVEYWREGPQAVAFLVNFKKYRPREEV